MVHKLLYVKFIGASPTLVCSITIQFHDIRVVVGMASQAFPGSGFDHLPSHSSRFICMAMLRSRLILRRSL